MKKHIILIIISTMLTSCKVKTPKVKVTNTEKYDVIMWYSKENKAFWGIAFPFIVSINNPSYKKRELSYYKYFDKYDDDVTGVMHKIDENNSIKKRTWSDKNLFPKKTQLYVMYSRHSIDTLKYPRSLFKEYYQKLQESGLQDSLPIGTLAEFKQKHPKLVADLLKNDSISFNFPFPKRDKEKGYAQGVRVPVKW